MRTIIELPRVPEPTMSFRCDRCTRTHGDMVVCLECGICKCEDCASAAEVLLECCAMHIDEGAERYREGVRKERQSLIAEIARQRRIIDMTQVGLALGAK